MSKGTSEIFFVFLLLHTMYNSMCMSLNLPKVITLHLIKFHRFELFPS